MDLLRPPLRDLHAQATTVVARSDAERWLERATETELAQQLAAVGDLQRLVEALLLDAVGEVMRRSEQPVRDERMTSHLGCRDVTELVEKLTRVDARSAARLQRAATAVRQTVSEITGERCAAPYPEVRDAMIDGVLGVDGVLSITEPLRTTAPRVSESARRDAAAIVIAEARGEGPDGAPPACAALLKIHAQTWAIALDQDGAEPRERAAERKRSVVLGVATAHGVPMHGMLLPDVAAQLQTIFDAQLSPKVAFVPDDDPSLTAPRDDRSRAQRQHDALAAALGVAASSGLLPTLGGHAPTLVVQVTEEDLSKGKGYAHAQGCDEPISIDVARHIACAGTIQRVTSRDGRIIAIGNEERVFNRHQRRAIALRDGGCIIPGCGTPAAWCEIHHVVEHAVGGPTHTDNGVLLCWFHHRFLDKIGWRIRMNRGVPEVMAPSWFDTSMTWRAVTTSPVRLRSAIRRT
ncbi:HNH endonuclease [Microbacterium marinum]|uniref:HNH endonuclease signature motif containing protein n=1 Tax=Microbacterium marinum TaxID=421115 RepID=UPI003851623B